jgi:sugar phosphate isomerase/epimerase
MAIGGEDYGEAAVERLGDTLFHVHSKDVSFYDSEPANRQVGKYNRRFLEVVLMGNGQVDHRPAYKALSARGYDGYFTMESLAQNSGLSAEEVARHDFLAFREDMKAIR